MCVRVSHYVSSESLCAASMRLRWQGNSGTAGSYISSKSRSTSRSFNACEARLPTSDTARMVAAMPSSSSPVFVSEPLTTMSAPSRPADTYAATAGAQPTRVPSAEQSDHGERRREARLLERPVDRLILRRLLRCFEHARASKAPGDEEGNGRRDGRAAEDDCCPLGRAEDGAGRDGQHEGGRDGHDLQEDHQRRKHGICDWPEVAHVADQPCHSVRWSGGPGPLLQKVEHEACAGNLYGLCDQCRGRDRRSSDQPIP
eukprot:6202447-Pleurochrysis_carterae.AAC.3